jgi:hypothetical protein
VRKGYLEIHFAVDTKTKRVVSLDVSSKKVPDSKRLKRLVSGAKENGVRVKRVLAEGAYDWKDDFKFLFDNGIKPLIRVMSNSVPRSRWLHYEEVGSDRAANVQTEIMEPHSEIRLQVENRGSVLLHQENLRRVRVCKEIRQIGKGNGDEGINLQRIHQGDGEGPRRRSAMTIPVLTRPALMSEPQYTRDELSRCEHSLKKRGITRGEWISPSRMPRIKQKGVCGSPLASLMASSLDLFVFKRLFQRRIYGYASSKHHRPDNQVIVQTHSVSIEEYCSF